MDPKDLKNSEEFKSNLPNEPEQREDAVEADGQPAGNKGDEKKESQEKKVKSSDKSKTKKTTKPPPVNKTEKVEKEVKQEIPKKEVVDEEKEKTTEAVSTDLKSEKVEEVKKVENTEEKEIPEKPEKPKQEKKKSKKVEAESVKDEDPKETKSEVPKVEKKETKEVVPEEKPDKSKELKSEDKIEVEADNKETEDASSEKKEEVEEDKPEVPDVDIVESKKVIQEKKPEEAEESVKSDTDKKESEESTDDKKDDETVLESTDKVENIEPPKAEKVTHESLKQEAKKEEIDYTKYSQVELINALRDLLDENEGQDIKRDVEAIKSHFYKLLVKEKEEAKEKFIEEGGIEEEYVEEINPYEQDIKDLLKRFRYIRIEYNKKLEVRKEENLKLKYEVIEEIKNLINNEESINKTFQEFRDLQNRWREIGLVPQSKMKDLWDTYHFHVENFYNYIKINKELRDLDLKKNLELKIKLCERAEELLLEPSIIRAFNTLQKLHERWREIGPVPRDKKDEIWERFKSATSKINKKHQEFFEDRKSEQKKNLEAKTALCEKAEEIANSEIKSHRDWDVKSKELIEIQKVWRTIGFAPKRDNNKIYERFRQACDKYFDNRREFYAKNKEIQQNNLQMKIDLCVQAESLKDSTDWKKTTQDYINIQKKWKEIGPVPRKHSDQVWKRFRDACDYFFNMKSKHFSDIDGEQGENLKLKEELIKEVEAYKVTKNVDEDLKQLKEFQRKWTEIGHVPIKQKDSIQNKFRSAINKHFDDLKLDDSKRDMLKFKNKVSNITETSRGKNKMRLERDKYMNQLKQMESDLILLDNNIGFFAKSKNAEGLIADVNKKIEKTKERIELLKKKIRIIDEYDDE